MTGLLKAMRGAARAMPEEQRPAIREAMSGGCLLTAPGGETITIPWSDIRENKDELPELIEAAVQTSLNNDVAPATQ